MIGGAEPGYVSERAADQVVVGVSGGGIEMVQHPDDVVIGDGQYRSPEPLVHRFIS